MSQNEFLKNTPEFIETNLQESLLARQESSAAFKELGPPDLVHLAKSSGRPNAKDVGSYHFVTGVDASSSASLAAYLNTLTYALGEGKYSGKSGGWRIATGIYCCYNAFSRVDMRVEVKFPGKTEAYSIDDRGTKHENPTAEMWLETYLSAVVRAILYSDDATYRLTGWRKLDPVPDLDSETRFLEAAEKLFENGWQLGSDPDVQIATSTTNHLTSALLQYFRYTGRGLSAVNLFEKLRERNPEVSTLLVKAYLDMDEEIKAVNLMCDALLKVPLNYALLDVQCDYLMQKGRGDLALQIAKRAVNCAPSEFSSWARLTEVYILLDEYEQALLTLNACPMFTFYEKDNYRLPVAKTASLPTPPAADTDEIANEVNVASSDADQALLRLPAPALRGTFARAYELLTKLVTKVGWDALLKSRSQVFVMEEEYRSQKAPAAGSVSVNGTTHADDDEDKPDEVTLAEPVIAHTASEEEKPEGSQIKAEPQPSFQDKRLCERWLDNLFMVLYEDLRVYTIWRAESTHFKSQNLSYRKTGLEWEILGDLAWRLQHEQEAEEAYQAAVEQQFSIKAWRRLLEIYQDRSDYENALTCVVKSTTQQHRWYQEYSPELLRRMRRMIDDEGLVKVQNVIASKTLPRPALDLMNRYFSFAVRFQVEGAAVASN
ncbi:Chs5p-Arf1p-binding proteins-domain-containing protein [Protomyces lactucae-debilis]|uniref:Chs5p-Arf1p-binding proteins-domain-containing protein n=1 Tax=Protomyces lactucae-debilis TaxID=2754530 RepID=A0A1Y2FKE3_PROLT|nr:Chs5p-Arf1p-binding proteins-domain-containing protein [Protomyces lactucae-debilis]ORY83686.1 Chs5p-Arf1p-binding proteins-domain-containing protein [Protomyces lactucae-debilis]